MASMFGSTYACEQFFNVSGSPTGVPQHPRVPFTITKGAAR